MKKKKRRKRTHFANTSDGRRFHLGVFVGIDRRMGQYMLHDGEGVKLARTVMRMPTADKWSKDALSSTVSTPYSLHGPKEPEIVFREAADAQWPQFDPKVTLSRQV